MDRKGCVDFHSSPQQKHIIHTWYKRTERWLMSGKLSGICSFPVSRTKEPLMGKHERRQEKQMLSPIKGKSKPGFPWWPEPLLSCSVLCKSYQVMLCLLVKGCWASLCGFRALLPDSCCLTLESLSERPRPATLFLCAPVLAHGLLDSSSSLSKAFPHADSAMDPFCHHHPLPAGSPGVYPLG